MKEATDDETFELVKDDGSEIIFDLIPREMKRDIYPNLFREIFTVKGRQYAFAGFSRIDSPGKLRYWGKRHYPPLRFIAGGKAKVTA